MKSILKMNCGMNIKKDGNHVSRRNKTSKFSSSFLQSSRSVLQYLLLFFAIYVVFSISIYILFIRSQSSSTDDNGMKTMLSQFELFTTKREVTVAHKLDNVHEIRQNHESRKHVPSDREQQPHRMKTRLLLNNFYFEKDIAEHAFSTYATTFHQKESGNHQNHNDEETEQKQSQMLTLTRIRPITAYLEPKMNDTIPNTGDTGNPDAKDLKDVGTPPDFVVPLPQRKLSPSTLRKVTYSNVRSCRDMPGGIPVDAGLGENDEPMYGNAGRNLKNNLPEPNDYAKYCPVDADPFLPWIHDLFPSIDGTSIRFVAQNKRRCLTGKNFRDSIDRLVPQVTIMQAISVKRLEGKDEEAKELAPNLWFPSEKAMDEAQRNYDQLQQQYFLEEEQDIAIGMPRYRLSSMEDASEDGNRTRFLCRFHTLSIDETTSTLQNIILGETLSTFPFDYEYVNYRKQSLHKSMLTPKGKDNTKFWLSNFKFECPIPNNGNLQSIVRSGEAVLHDGTPSIYVDVVPIRTSARYLSDAYFTTDMVGPSWKKINGFDPNIRWGTKNVLPMVEASGRWSNLPICQIPSPPNILSNHGSNDISTQQINRHDVISTKNTVTTQSTNKREKPYQLTACLWASASFKERGNAGKVDNTIERLKEWVEFHLLVGFEHIFVYDNTGAHTTKTSLEEALSIFNKSEVTRINWPSMICNNNKPADENTGERSSQYAAESSCLQRYGPLSEWIAVFDTDEYLIPMGNYEDLKDFVSNAYSNGTKILSFKSTRASIDYKFTEPFYDGKKCGKKEESSCITKQSDALYIETYNCDTLPFPKPDWAQRARKQLFRTDYVLSHFVHYATVTKGIAATYAETMSDKSRRFRFSFTEDNTIERFTDENNEAVMLHTKTSLPLDTFNYKINCKVGFVETWKDKCRVGFTYPNNIEAKGTGNEEGFEYNCFSNEKLTNFWIPKLREAIYKRSCNFEKCVK
mmetsp:Transcript_7245/g.10376  ORF Transcript_7245/g.10376 Transcript_7245/m.10376 type:complete len:967 (+) Transcript_7245:49-2949(+)